MRGTVPVKTVETPGVDPRQAQSVLRARNQELRILHAISERMHSADSLEAAYEYIVEEISAATGFPIVAIEHYDEARGVMEFAGATGVPAPNTEHLSVPVDETLSGIVARTGQPLIETHAWERSEYSNDTLCQLGVETFVCLPIAIRDRVIGALSLAAPEHRALDEQLLQLAATIANQLAVLVECQETDVRLQRQLDRFNALHSLNGTMSASLELEDILYAVIEKIEAQQEVDACAVLLLDAQIDTLEYAAGRGFQTGAIEQTRLALGEGAAGRAAEERRTLVLPDLDATCAQIARPHLFVDEQVVGYAVAPLVARGRLKGVLELFRRIPLPHEPEGHRLLQIFAGQVAIAIDNAQLVEDLQRANAELEQTYEATLAGWARALELRDLKTEGHTRRVTDLTVRVAREMGIAEDDLVYIRWGALLHDMGKMAVPDSILQKSESLSDEEWALMQQHPVYAYEMLAPIEALQPALDIPYYHHERWDGSGYPEGLEGEEIPLAARIFAVVDVWDALRSERPYEEPWSDEEALAHIRARTGEKFDPVVVEVFLDIVADE